MKVSIPCNLIVLPTHTAPPTPPPLSTTPPHAISRGPHLDLFVPSSHARPVDYLEPTAELGIVWLVF